MLVTTIYFEYWEHAYTILWNVFMSLLHHVFSLFLLSTSTTTPQRICCWSSSYMTQSLFVAVKAEQSVSPVERLHRSEAFGCFRLGVTEVRSAQHWTWELNTWVLQKGNAAATENGSCFKLVSGLLAGNFWISSWYCCVWHKANMKVLLEQPVGALTYFF